MHNEHIEERISTPVLGSYDVIVAGGGVAGVAAAVAARRAGRSVLLIEKSMMLGGLATLGLINFFVPMCNGRGAAVVKGLAEELLRLSIRYGYDTLPEPWREVGDDGKLKEPGNGKTNERYITRYSAPIFAIAMTELLDELGVAILYDTVVVRPVMDGKVCRGLVVENKSGRGYYECGVVADVTGEADVLYRAGVPCVTGTNFYTYIGHGITLESCKKAVETGDVGAAQADFSGGSASLYGTNHPVGMKLWNGVTGEETSEYLVKNQRDMLDKLKKTDRKSRDVLVLPGMPQFRTTRRIDGDATLRVTDAYRHFDDSVGAINDFDRRDYLYEVPFGALVRREFPNLITAGRCASGDGYAWDILRVIPPAILTGQAAGEAAAMAVEKKVPIAQVDIKELQSRLALGGVDIHFDDSLVPESGGGERADVGHI